MILIINIKFLFRKNILNIFEKKNIYINLLKYKKLWTKLNFKREIYIIWDLKSSLYLIKIFNLFFILYIIYIIHYIILILLYLINKVSKFLIKLYIVSNKNIFQ